MPPIQPAETLAALGIIAGVVVFLIMVVLIGVVALIEEAVKRGKNRLVPRRLQEEK
ncbi:hypothetical protein SEA_CLUBPENGUIN_75 [Streptomyces phage ClubPenguin]|nr:hypothetical protein SEA_CLUBPENGUIN_75 [Streptomyces phage ClubPenguin]